MSVVRGNKNIKVVYPSGCKEVNDEVGKDEMVRRLKVYTQESLCITLITITGFRHRIT